MMIFPSLQHSCLSLTANDLLFIHAVVFMLPCIAIFLIVIDELGHIHSNSHLPSHDNLCSQFCEGFRLIEKTFGKIHHKQ